MKKKTKKIIVYIDDLDRLDDEEIHSVFKLVKLIADFRHTTYILAFDEEIVENVLSTKYSGKKASEIGTSFLEKIIQVPLYLPPADSEDIRRIIFQGFVNVLKGNQIVLSDEELRRFNEIWSTTLGILPLTIRAAKKTSKFNSLFLAFT
ncbi:P-loop NTPase fold protein [Bacillus cereus]